MQPQTTLRPEQRAEIRDALVSKMQRQLPTNKNEDLKRAGDRAREEEADRLRRIEREKQEALERAAAEALAQAELAEIAHREQAAMMVDLEEASQTIMVAEDSDDEGFMDGFTGLGRGRGRGRGRRASSAPGRGKTEKQEKKAVKAEVASPMRKLVAGLAKDS